MIWLLGFGSYLSFVFWGLVLVERGVPMTIGVKRVKKKIKWIKSIGIRLRN